MSEQEYQKVQEIFALCRAIRAADTHAERIELQSEKRDLEDELATLRECQRDYATLTFTLI